MVKTDVAFAISPFAAWGGGGDPEQRLAVASARHIRVIVFALEAEEAEHLVIERLRAPEIADTEDEVVYADDAWHGLSLGKGAASIQEAAARRIEAKPAALKLALPNSRRMTTICLPGYRTYSLGRTQELHFRDCCGGGVQAKMRRTPLPRKTMAR